MSFFANAKPVDWKRRFKPREPIAKTKFNKETEEFLKTPVNGGVKFEVKFNEVWLKDIAADWQPLQLEVGKQLKVELPESPNQVLNENLKKAIADVDISRFPIPMRLVLIFNKSLHNWTDHGIDHGFALYCKVQAANGMGEIHVVTPWRVPLEDTYEQCVEHIRKACQHFVLHEMDEFFIVKGEQIYNPHASNLKKSVSITKPKVYCWTGIVYDDAYHQDLKFA